MPIDHIRYDILAQQALRDMVRNVLTDTARKGLPGEHHFYISFDTRSEGVRLSNRLHEKYPEEMTIVLQHQFWDLKVGEEEFEVGLSFGGMPERLVVPFSAIRSFVDPTVQFALQFEQLGEAEEQTAPLKPKAEKPEKPAGRQSAARERPFAKAGRVPARTVPSIPPKPPLAAPITPPVPSNVATPEDEPDKPNGGAEVVRLDRFRKK